MLLRRRLAAEAEEKARFEAERLEELRLKRERQQRERVERERAVSLLAVYLPAFELAKNWECAAVHLLPTVHTPLPCCGWM